MKTIILNKNWNVKDLLIVSSITPVKDLIDEYIKDPNCRPYDWIINEKITDLEKASFIYTILNQI
jgi:hypothetical protein